VESIYLLIPIALVLVIIGIAIFFWAVNSGQYDDLEGPAHSILFDDEPTVKKMSHDKKIDNASNTNERINNEQTKHD